MNGRTQGITRVLLLTLVLNWLVAGAKLTVGLLTGNLTVIGDALHSFLDGANNVVGLVAVNLAAAPPDAEHPYGHHKFENVAAMLIGGLLVLMCWEMLRNIGFRVFTEALSGEARAAELPPPLLLAIIVATLAVNLFVSWYERREGTRLNSAFLKADAAHTLSDSLVTGLGLASLLLAPLTRWADPILAVGVLIFLIRAAWTIITDNVAALTDRAQIDPQQIREIAEGVRGVRAADGIRSHGTGNDIHLDLHIVVSADLSARQTEDVEEAVREALRHRFDGVTLIAIEHRTSPGHVVEEG